MREVRKRDKKERCDLRRQQKMERGAAVMCDERLFYRRAAATGNALLLTVDRRVRWTSRDVDEAERSRHLASVYAGRPSSSHRYVGARPCWHLHTKKCFILWPTEYIDINDCLVSSLNITVSQKTHQLWNGIARNFKDRFWWYLAKIFTIV